MRGVGAKFFLCTNITIGSPDLSRFKVRLKSSLSSIGSRFIVSITSLTFNPASSATLPGSNARYQNAFHAFHVGVERQLRA